MTIVLFHGIEHSVFKQIYFVLTECLTHAAGSYKCPDVPHVLQKASQENKSNVIRKSARCGPQYGTLSPTLSLVGTRHHMCKKNKGDTSLTNNSLRCIQVPCKSTRLGKTNAMKTLPNLCLYSIKSYLQRRPMIYPATAWGK